jgi:hypothetical protein
VVCWFFQFAVVKFYKKTYFELKDAKKKSDPALLNKKLWWNLKNENNNLIFVWCEKKNIIRGGGDGQGLEIVQKPLWILFIGSGLSFVYPQGIPLHIALQSSCLFDSFYTTNIVGNPRLVTLWLLPNGEQSERDELCVTDDEHAAEKLGPIALGFLCGGGEEVQDWYDILYANNTTSM